MARLPRRTGAFTLSILIALTILGSVGLAAQSNTGKPVELEFWYAYSGVVQETNEYLTKAFNETVGKEKGIRVTASYQGGYSDLNQKVQAAYIAGNAPDVFTLDIGSAAAFAENGIIQPLNSYVSRDKFDLSDFQDGIITNCKVGKNLFGLPYLTSTCIMYLNTSILERAGLDPSGPKTWDELATYCRTIKKKTGQYGLTLFSYEWLYEAILLQSGASVLSADQKSSNIDGKAALDAVKFFANLQKEGVIRILASTDASKLSADIMGQKCGMWFFSSAGITTYIGLAKKNGFAINTCFLPKKVTYGTSTGGCNLVISNKSSRDKKDAAWTFIKWMTDAEQTVYASTHTGYMPSRKSVITSDGMKKLYASVPQFKVAVDQMVYASPTPMAPRYAEASNIITDALDAVWVNGKAAETVFAEAQKKVDALLAE